MKAIKKVMVCAMVAFAILAGTTTNASAGTPQARAQYMRPVSQSVASKVLEASKASSAGKLHNYSKKQQYTGFNLALLPITTLNFARWSLLLRGFTGDQIRFFEAIGYGADLYDASLASLPSLNYVGKVSKWCSNGESEAKAYVDSKGSITGRRLFSFELSVNWCLSKRKNGQTYVRVRRAPTTRSDTTTLGALQGYRPTGIIHDDAHMEGNNYYARYIGGFTADFLGWHVGDCEAVLTIIIRSDGTVWTSSAGSHC